MPYSCSLPCRRRSDKTFSILPAWGSEGDLPSRGDNRGPSPYHPAVTALLPASKRQEKPLCPQPGAAAVGDGSRRDLHGTAFEKPAGVSSRLAAVSFAPSPCRRLPAAPRISRLAGSWQLLPPLQWVPPAFQGRLLPAALWISDSEYQEEARHLQQAYYAGKPVFSFFSLHICIFMAGSAL